jgi:hypothetical protein
LTPRFPKETPVRKTDWLPRKREEQSNLSQRLQTIVITAARWSVGRG